MKARFMQMLYGVSACAAVGDAALPTRRAQIAKLLTIIVLHMRMQAFLLE
jgi:hypothetical protein